MRSGSRCPSLQSAAMKAFVCSFITIPIAIGCTVQSDGEATGQSFVETTTETVVDTVPIQHAKEALAEGNGNEFELRMQLARAYMSFSRYEDALEQFLWVLDNAKASYPLNSDEYWLNPQFWEDFRSLIEKHPPAKQAVVNHRIVVKKKMLATEALEQVDIVEVVLLYSALSDCINEYQDLLATIRQLSELNDAQNASAILFALVRGNLTSLISSGFSEDVVEAIDVRRWAEWDIALARFTRTALERDGESTSSLGSAQTIREDVSPWYRMLVSANKLEDAEAVAESLLKLHDDAETFYVLAKIGLESENASVANVEQARKSTELDPSQVRYLETLIKLLHVTGSTDEAIRVAQDHLDSESSDYKNTRIRETLEKLR